MGLRYENLFSPVLADDEVIEGVANLLGGGQVLAEIGAATPFPWGLDLAAVLRSTNHIQTFLREEGRARRSVDGHPIGPPILITTIPIPIPIIFTSILIGRNIDIGIRSQTFPEGSRLIEAIVNAIINIISIFILNILVIGKNSPSDFHEGALERSNPVRSEVVGGLAIGAEIDSLVIVVEIGKMGGREEQLHAIEGAARAIRLRSYLPPLC